jgi:hypothetical protein
MGLERCTAFAPAAPRPSASAHRRRAPHGGDAGCAAPAKRRAA